MKTTLSVLDINKSNKTFSLPIWVLACIQAFTVWQMGIVFYSSKTFTINGVSPLPISIETAAIPISLGYIAGALLAFFLPHRVGLWARILTCISLISILLMFIPFNTFILAHLYYLMAFTCVTFISSIATLEITVYSLNTALKDGIICSIVALPFIALLHILPFLLDFRIYNGIAAVIQIIVLIGLSRIPVNNNIKLLPLRQPIRKEQRVHPPSIIYVGTFFTFAIICLCVLFSSTTAESVSRGIPILYISGFLWGVIFAFFALYKKYNPFHMISVYLGIAAIGYILWLLPVPAVSPFAIAFQGTTLCLSNLGWLLGAILFEKWNSRFIAPCTIMITLITVLIHTELLNAMRFETEILYGIYGCIALALLIVYFLIEPYFKNVWTSATETNDIPDILSGILTKREIEITFLVVQGYINEDIAKILIISEHTVKTHIKNIYQKLEVHNRFQLAVKITNMKNKP